MSSPPFLRNPYPLHFEQVIFPTPSHPLQLRGGEGVAAQRERLCPKEGRCAGGLGPSGAHSCEKKNSFDSLYIWKPVTAATSCETGGHAPQVRDTREGAAPNDGSSPAQMTSLDALQLEEQREREARPKRLAHPRNYPDCTVPHLSMAERSAQPPLLADLLTATDGRKL